MRDISLNEITPRRVTALRVDAPTRAGASRNHPIDVSATPHRPSLEPNTQIQKEWWE